MGTNTNPEQLVFGLDIGTRSVVGTVGYKKNQKEFVVVAQSTRFHETRAMLDGQIHDISAVAETVGDVRRELEKKTGKKLTDVCIAAAGRVLKTHTIRTDYGLGEEMVITDELIRSMELIGVEQANAELRAKEKSDITYFCVGYSVIRYYLGDVPMLSLEGHKGSRIGADILATFLPQDVVDGLNAATDRAGLTVVNLTLEPIAAINLAIPEKFRLLNLALVDIGAGTSDICITKGGSVVAYGMIPCAGDFLTEAIMTEYLVEFNTAEAIKIALSEKKKRITFTDIMGLKQSVAPSEVRKVLDKPMKDLAKQIAEKIAKLNGNKSVSAIFIVGGGGKNPDFAKILSDCSHLPKDRVALRGAEVLNDVHFLEEGIVKDPMLVTPIGICLNYYEQNNNFIFVKCNDDLVKLYDNGRLTVMDAAMGIGFANENLFPKRGKELDFTVNGKRRLIRGEAGESAVITINGKPGSIASPIVRNDDIKITDSTAGEDAHATVRDLDGIGGSIIFYVNGKKVSCPKLITNGTELVTEMYDIKSGDNIKVLDYYTVDKLIEYMDVDREGTVMVNNVIALGDEKLYENFTVDFGITNADLTAAERESGELEKQEAEELSKAITVKVNGLDVVMTGHASYTFVNILDFYHFDIAEGNGRDLIMTVNGEKAEFITPVDDGAVVELKWS
ncbi:MAG: rod shape-determining protein [Lachnospiraceae bacterium]|nr:rod shape-determining protein [Lachnospiraceae bacterium]